MRKILALLGMSAILATGCSISDDSKFSVNGDNPTSFNDIRRYLNSGEIEYVKSLQANHQDEELEIECYFGQELLDDIDANSIQNYNDTCKGIEAGGRESSTNYVIEKLLGINSRVITYTGKMKDDTLLLLENAINFNHDTDIYKITQPFYTTSLTLLTGANQQTKKYSSAASDRAPGLTVLYDNTIPNDIIAQYKATVFPSTLNGYDPDKGHYDRFCEVNGEPTDLLSNVVPFTTGCDFRNKGSLSVLNVVASDPQFFVYLTTNEKYSKYIDIRTDYIGSVQNESLSKSLMLATTESTANLRSRKLVVKENSKYSRLLDVVDKLLSIDEIAYKVSQKARATKVYAAKGAVIKRLSNIYNQVLTTLPMTIKWTSPPYTRHGGVAIENGDNDLVFGPYADIMESISEVYREIRFEYVDFGSDSAKWEVNTKKALSECSEIKCDLNLIVPYISNAEVAPYPASNFTQIQLNDSVQMSFYSVDNYINKVPGLESMIYTVSNTPYDHELHVRGYKNHKSFDTIHEALTAAKRDKVFLFGSSDWQFEDLAYKQNKKIDLTTTPVRLVYASSPVGFDKVRAATMGIAHTFADMHDNMYVMDEWYGAFDTYLSLKASKYQSVLDTRRETQTQFYFIIITTLVLSGGLFVAYNINARNRKEKEKLELIDTTIQADTSISLMTVNMDEKRVYVMRGDAIIKIFHGAIFTLKDFLAFFNLNSTQFVGILATASTKTEEQIVISNKDTNPQNPVYFTVSSHLYNDSKLATVALRDITEDVKEKEHLKEKVERDELTGLFSRISYKHKIEEVLSDPMITTGFIAFMDINDFKETNDKYGHKTGDHLLTSFADRLKTAFKDIEGSILVRISGDEFLAYVPNVDDAQAKDICMKTVEILDEPFEIDTESGEGIIQIKAKPSLGYAMYGSNSKDIDRLVQFADFAMYKAKLKKHIDRLPVHKFEMNEYVAETKVKIEIKFLRDAIQNKSFTSWFQPILEVKTGKIYGYEALARPLITSLPNIGRCMELADKTWLLKPLTKTLSEIAAKNWAEKGNDKSIFINEPPFLVYNEGENNHIKELIDKVGRDKVVIEITEQFSFRPEDLTRKCEELQQAGINIAIDDFGSGHANMLMFETIHPKIVKIDRSLLKDIDKDEKRRRTVEHLIKFINESQILSLAEGVETMEEFQILKDAGVDLVQGYLFAKPNPEVTLVAEERFAMVMEGKMPPEEVITSNIQMINDQDKEIIDTLKSNNLTQDQLEKLEKEAIGFDSYINLKEQNSKLMDLENHKN